MAQVLDRMTGALYRVGLHHEAGRTSMVSLAARPVRLTVGELAASAADAVSSLARSRPERRSDAAMREPRRP